VAKYTSGGALVWARSYAGPGNASNDLALAADGSVYAVGSFSGTLEFDPGAGSSPLTGAGGSDAFVWKLDAAGDFVWAKSLGGTSTDAGTALAVAADGSVYAAGHFSDTADFDPGGGAFNLTSAGANDAFVCKLDGAGDFVWAVAWGGASSDRANDVALGGDDSVMVTGSFSGTADFDPGAGTLNLASAGLTDAFVSRLDTAGNLVWARSVGSWNNDSGSKLALGTDGSVYTVGTYLGTADFDPGPGTFALTSIGDTTDVFVWKLDGAGNFVWVRQAGGLGGESGRGIAASADGTVYTTGSFWGPADFDPAGGVARLVGAGAADMFLAKWLPPHAPSGVALPENRVLEQQPSGTAIGGFVSTDADSGETFSYRLVVGPGDTDNVSFVIRNGVLRTNAVFDVNVRTSYSVRVRSTDSAGLWVESALTVQV